MPTIGASGGLFALLLAFGMLFPNRIIMPLFPPIPMKARTFVMVFGAIELVSGLPRPIRHRALRAPGRHGRRLPDDPLLAAPAAVRPAARTPREDPAVDKTAPAAACSALTAEGRHHAGAGIAGDAADLRQRPGGRAAPSIEAQSRALERASAAVVGLRTVAVDGARTERTLGRERSGSGVVISADGLVLTIGYLVLEADDVEVVDDDDHHIPARVIGYDTATGFGLVQPLVPLKRPPVPLGDPLAVRGDDSLVVMSGGDDGHIGAARLVSRRPFSGYWEYHVDGALFTAPPHPGHSGAALFNLQGELLGIGSLAVSDAAGADEDRLPGNMFVPVDLLKPILAEMRAQGASRASARAWIGVNCIEQSGEIRVLRVADDSPADVAGLQPGDRIVRIDGSDVARLDELWKRLWSGSAAEREVRLEILRDGERQELSVQSVDRAKTLRRAQGI